MNFYFFKKYSSFVYSIVFVVAQCV